ncbi:MAG TPA: radical SAM protein, partial [Ruminococcaceae bacterium]|nr:radical SAM protein [Oscillospiraceae bacterium]
MLSMKACALCPRKCGIDRTRQTGFCGSGSQIKVARAALHHWEEPCISGTKGSGTVFFSGCTLRCCYCQNYRISTGGFGKEISTKRLGEIFLELQKQGAHNINLVTATQFVPQVLEALNGVHSQLRIPIAYNCGGYERIETIQALKGAVSIFMPDFKYVSETLSTQYSGAPDYFVVATAAIQEMVKQIGGLQYDEQGILQRGVIIRHLVLPGARKDSFRVLQWIHAHLPKGQYLLSLMSQYTPAGPQSNPAPLKRR